MSASVSRDDIEGHLLERVRRGDGDALRLVFDRHAANVHRLAFHLLGSADDADDVVQDVFLGLRTSLTKYAHEGRFDLWLRRVTARVALMRLRTERRHETRAHAATTASPAVIVGDPTLRETLSRAIAELPTPLRTVFVLRMVEDYTHEEIAATLNVSVSACKVRLHRALRRLRPQLEHLREDR